MPNDSDREQAAEGALILHRLVPAPDHGAGFRRDPETGFVYYSSEWLGDPLCPECGAPMDEPQSSHTGVCPTHGVQHARSDAKPSE